MKELVIRALISFVVTIILGFITLPILKKINVGRTERADGPEKHLDKKNTPIMGGIIMLVTLLIILGISCIKYPLLLLPLVSILGFGLVGFIDDYIKMIQKKSGGISATVKIVGLFLVIAIFIFLYLNVFELSTTIIIPIFNVPVNLSVPIFIAFTVFVMLGTSNSVNLTDGLDGLASRCCSNYYDIFYYRSIKAK